MVERARNSAPVNPDPLYEISPDGIAQMIRQPRTPEEQQAANDIFKARWDNDMARIRQIVDAINRVPSQEVDTRTPEQIQADHEYALRMNSSISWGAGTRKKEAPVNIPRQAKNNTNMQTDSQLMADFRASIGRAGNEPLGMNDMRDFNAYKMNQKSIWIDRNGNGRIDSMVKWARVSASGQWSSASGPGAENIVGGVGG